MIEIKRPDHTSARIRTQKELGETIQRYKLITFCIRILNNLQSFSYSPAKKLTMNPRSWRSIGDYQRDMIAVTMLLRMIFELIRLTLSYVRLMWPDLHRDTCGLHWILICVVFCLSLSLLFTSFVSFGSYSCYFLDQVWVKTLGHKIDDLGWLG